MQNTGILTIPGGASTAVAFPKNGTGGITTGYLTPKVTGAATFTQNTATFGAVAAVAGGAVGDYVATSDGHWGVLSAISTTTLITVDRWRAPGAHNGPALPGAGATATIYQGKNILVGSKAIRIVRIIVYAATGTDTLSITNARGATIATPLTLPVDITTPFTFELGDNGGGGLLFECPIGVIASRASDAWSLVWVDAN